MATTPVSQAGLQGLRDALARADEAASTLQRALPALEEERAMLAYGLSARAAVALSIGDTQAALEDSARALAIVEELGGIEDGEGFVWWVRAEALGAAGDGEAAHARTRAVERLAARANVIADPALRARFLAEVPEHRATWAWRSLGDA